MRDIYCEATHKLLTGFFTDSSASCMSQLLHSSVRVATSNVNPSVNSRPFLFFLIGFLLGWESYNVLKSLIIVARSCT